jgi:hypothetical protein
MTEKELLEKMLSDIELLKIDVEMLIHNDNMRNRESQFSEDDRWK